MLPVSCESPQGLKAAQALSQPDGAQRIATTIRTRLKGQEVK